MEKVKRRATPPLWCRAALYGALWPRPEFREYRISLQREYVRRLKYREDGERIARRYAIRVTITWCQMIAYRLCRLSGLLRLAALLRVYG